MLEQNCAETCAQAQEKSKKSTRLVDYSPVDRPWDVHRSQAQTVESLYKNTEFDVLSGKIRGCSGFLGFAWVNDTDTGEMRLRLRSARFCRVRYCPVCAWRRSLMHKARFLSYLPQIIEKHPRARWLFLTLTVKNCEISQLRETLASINKAWGRFVKREEFSSALGWIRSTEVTRAKDGSAHPHFHCLLLVKPSYFTRNYVKQSRWAEIWQECLRVDYLPVVDIRVSKGDAYAAAEVLKYSTKPGDLIADSRWLEQLTKQTRGLRFLATGGVLREAIKEHEEKESDLLLASEENQDSEKEPDLWFDWNRAKRYYEKR